MANIGLACPTCEAATGKKNPLVNTPGKFGYSCSESHTFRDTEELLAMKPSKIDVPMKLQKPAGERSDLHLSIPVKLMEALRERFKEKLETTMTPVLISLLDPGAFIMGGFDFERLNAIFGEKVKGPDHLYGLCFTLKAERDDAKKQAESQKSQVGQSEAGINVIDGDFVQLSLRIPVEEYVTIKGKATFNNMQPSAYLAQSLSHALKNEWL